MHLFDFQNYTLILSHDPCDIFRHYNVNEMHGLNLKDCTEHKNTTENAYMAGFCNLSPIDSKPFVFINLSRCSSNDIKLMGLVMHELSHLFWLLNNNNLQEKEEEIITNAELESYKIVDIIKNIQ
jgi:hypothetical protein